MKDLHVDQKELGEEITVNEVKENLKEILDWIVSICENNDINYYLAEGTLLGAVRHHGFIPWDDDIDIIMLRPDYNKFISITKNYNDERFFVAYSLDDPRHTRPYMRVYDESVIIKENYKGSTTYLNLNVDIFPSDGVPSNKLLYYLRCFIVRCLIGLASIDMSRKVVTGNVIKSGIKIFLLPIARVVGYRNWYKIVDRIGKSKKIENSKYIGIAVTPDCIKERIKKIDFIPQTCLNFEGKRYTVPQNYDLVLHNLYGDYMTPPPKDGRIQAHNRKFYKSIRG